MKSPFDLTNPKAVIPFDEVDPYNLQNRLEGFVNRRQGQLYGALWITKVNGKICKQLIYSAPKQHYPFEKSYVKWEFPECDYVDLYEKLDGTCIISYVYKDKKGDVFLTYKTRLRPFLGSGKFGNFLELWNEMLEKYPQITNYTFDEYHNCIFELYGKRNKVLISYEIPLDTKLIFTINASNGQIYPPLESAEHDIDTIPVLENKGMLTDWHKHTLEGQRDLYNKIKEDLEAELDVDEETQILKGKEGYVMYFMKDGHAVQIKNKPPSVLKYHWAGNAIAYESLFTTCINAFENFDDPQYDDIVQLLNEEFELDFIEKSRVRINKVLDRVRFDKKLQYEIVEHYNKLGVNINKDKRTVMRHFATLYPKSQAQKIFTLLNSYVEKENE